MSEQVEKPDLKPSFVDGINFEGNCPNCKARRIFQPKKAKFLLAQLIGKETIYRCNVCRWSPDTTEDIENAIGKPNNPDKPKPKDASTAFVMMYGVSAPDMGAHPAMVLLPEEWDWLVQIYREEGEAGLYRIAPKDASGDLNLELRLVHPERHLTGFQSRVEAIKLFMQK